MCRVRRFCFKLTVSLKYCLIYPSIVTTTLIVWMLVINRQVLRPWHSKQLSNLEETITNSDTIALNKFYVLLWTNSDWAPFYYFTVKDVFTVNECAFQNCYVTDNKSYFGSDMSKFHAIAFNCRLENGIYWNMPRYQHQKFIFYNTESPINSVVRDDRFDGFFNWTSTYRLDSDIPYPYMLIKDSSGNIVGPKADMKWRRNMTEVDDDVLAKIRMKPKTNAALAFLSHCRAKSNRDNLMKSLGRHLRSKGYNLDVYGYCSSKKCPASKPGCNEMVEKYYFFLAFENSFDVDYVTEKVIRAFNHSAVPVVYGGANYSRFLPPGSYLNARNYSPGKLAAIMVHLIENPDEYRKLFGWKKYYKYQDPMSRENVCALCAALNNKTMYQTPSVHMNLRKWWNQ